MRDRGDDWIRDIASELDYPSQPPRRTPPPALPPGRISESDAQGLTHEMRAIPERARERELQGAEST